MSRISVPAPVEVNLENLPEATNGVYYPLYKNRDRYLVLFGGAGSGKSHFIVQKYLVRIIVGMSRGIKHKILALRKTSPAVRKSVFTLIQDYVDLWNLAPYVSVNKAEMVFKFSGGSQIICSGLDDPMKIKSIEGLTSIWMEEATEFDHSDFLQLDLRLRGHHNTYLQLCISFNPVECPWLKKEFFDIDNREDIQVIHGINSTNRYRRLEKVFNIESKIIKIHATTLLTTYKDNKFLDDIQKGIIVGLRDKDRTWYEIYALGMWGSPKGQVYVEGFNWAVTSKPWPNKKTFDYHGYGLDFGYSNAPTGLIEIGINDDTEEMWVREKIYETCLTNQDICKKLTSVGVTEYDIICADSAEPKSIEEIRREGWNIVECRKGKDSINHGINVVKQYFCHVYADSDNLIKEKRNYKWKEDKLGNSMNIPVDEYNHLLDGERYIVTKLVGPRAIMFAFNLGNRNRT